MSILYFVFFEMITVYCQINRIGQKKVRSSEDNRTLKNKHRLTFPSFRLAEGQYRQH